jgi:hypothetical protein
MGPGDWRDGVIEVLLVLAWMLLCGLAMWWLFGTSQLVGD